jgi:hypothetical protein
LPDAALALQEFREAIRAFERHGADMEAAADKLVAGAPSFTADEPLVSIIEALARLREDLAGANDKLDALEAGPP